LINHFFLLFGSEIFYNVRSRCCLYYSRFLSTLDVDKSSLGGSLSGRGYFDII
jgi:hypothetical protein